MINTKAEREYAEAIYKYTSGCDEAAKHIDRLSYEVDRLRMKHEALLAAAKLIIERDDHAMLDGSISLQELEEAVEACERDGP